MLQGLFAAVRDLSQFAESPAWPDLPNSKQLTAWPDLPNTKHLAYPVSVALSVSARFSSTTCVIQGLLH